MYDPAQHTADCIKIVVKLDTFNSDAESSILLNNISPPSVIFTYCIHQTHIEMSRHIHNPVNILNTMRQNDHTTTHYPIYFFY